MVQQTQYTGTGVAMITPFKNNEVDYPTIERIIEHLIEGGAE